MMEGLSGVAVGQLVIVEGSNNSEMVGKVLRFTPKGFVVVGCGAAEYTFRPSGRERSSDAWNTRFARPMTTEDRARIVLSNRRNEVKRAIEASWKSLTADECNAIMEILDGAKKEGGAE